MAAINGLAASVAWTGYTGLYASPGYIKPYQFSIDVQGGTIRTDGFGGSAVITQTNVAQPYSWTASFTSRSPNTPNSGYSGSVAWSAGNYATNVRDWTLDIRWTEKQVTAFDGSGVVAHSFIPLLASWGGTFSGYIDGTTALALPTTPGATLATLTLKALENGGGTDDTLAGSALATRMGGNAGVDQGGEFSYSFEGSGTLTAAGDNYGANSSGIFDDGAGTLVTPTAGQLTLTAASGRTYVGDAFPTGLSWRAGVDSGLEVVTTVRGTGALTIN
jgi:hypothetical protein